jgi:hypothetical protein
MSKRLLLLIGLLIFSSMVLLAQNKRAERKAASKAKKEAKKEAEIEAGEARFTKAVSAINAKDFVIFVDMLGHTQKINRDPASFLSYETDFVFVQGYAAHNLYASKLTVYNYSQTTDKDGNVTIAMRVRGFYIDERIEISLKKGDNNAEVNVIPGNGRYFYYSGELMPRSESDYFKRPYLI